MTDQLYIYDFAVRLRHVTTITDALVKSLHQAECSDASICERYGHIYLTFTRQAPSFFYAVHSVKTELGKAGFAVDEIIPLDLSLGPHATPVHTA